MELAALARITREQMGELSRASNMTLEQIAQLRNEQFQALVVAHATPAAAAAAPQPVPQAMETDPRTVPLPDDLGNDLQGEITHGIRALRIGIEGLSEHLKARSLKEHVTIYDGSGGPKNWKTNQKYMGFLKEYGKPMMIMGIPTKMLGIPNKC